VRISVTGFPFDLFGSGGAAAGVELLLDELREVMADNRREQVPTRAAAYAGQLQLRELPFDTLAHYQDWRERGRQAVHKTWEQDDCLFWLAGNHLGVLPVYDELAERNDTLVIQLDAHLDIHNFSTVTSELSHGNFLLHCAGKLPPIWNVGHRDLLLPAEYVKASYRKVIAADQLFAHEQAVLRELRNACRKARYVFVDIDCDVLDVVHFPAVGQPVPFGLSAAMLLRIMNAVWSERVIGLAVSEFHPAHDQNDRSLALLVWLLEYLLLKRFEVDV
jgi:agmatinase